MTQSFLAPSLTYPVRIFLRYYSQLRLFDFAVLSCIYTQTCRLKWALVSVTRAHIWFNPFQSFHRPSSGRNQKGGNTYNITIHSLHIENPQALPRTCLSPPGVSAQSRYQGHDRSAGPPWSEPPGPPPCTSACRSSSWEGTARSAAVLGVLPTTSPWQRSYRKASPPLRQMKKRPQMSAVTTSTSPA